MKICGLLEYVYADLREYVLIVKPIRPTTNYLYPSLQRHNSPAAIARELFKPSSDSASLLVSIKKFF